MSKGPYKDIKYTDFSGGLATRVENNLIKDNQSPDILNVIFDGKGSIVPRMGNKIFGATTSTIGKIRNTWTTSNILGNETPLRIINTSGSAWLEYYNAQTLAWENLDAGYTTGYDFGHCNFDFFNYYSNPVDYQRRWLGVSWATSTYADSAYHKVYINTSAASALGFLSAGSVVIDNEEVYYSSLSGNALSGITFTKTHNGSVGIASLPTSALETPVSTFPYYASPWVSASSALPHGTVMINKESQMFVAGISGTEKSVVYRSVLDDETNFTVSTAANYGGAETYSYGNGGVTAMANFDEYLAVMKRDVISKLKLSEIGDGVGGTIEILDKSNVTASPKGGAINNKSVAQVENDILLCSPNGWIKNIHNFDKGTSTKEMSLNVRSTVESLEMASASGIYFGGKYYLACANSGSTLNDVVMVWDYDYDAWTKFNGWNVSDWFIYDNKLYYGSSSEIATYQAMANYDDNQYGYTSYWASKWLDYDLPNEEKTLRQIYIEGYMTTNTSLGVSCYYDGNTTTPIKKSIEGDADYVVGSGDTIALLGETIWGQGSYGGSAGTATYTLNKFRVNLQYAPRPFYNMQIKIGTANPGSVWKVTHIVPYLRALPGERIPTNQLI